MKTSKSIPWYIWLGTAVMVMIYITFFHSLPILECQPLYPIKSNPVSFKGALKTGCLISTSEITPFINFTPTTKTLFSVPFLASTWPSDLAYYSIYPKFVLNKEILPMDIDLLKKYVYETSTFTAFKFPGDATGPRVKGHYGLMASIPQNKALIADVRGIYSINLHLTSSARPVNGSFPSLLTDTTKLLGEPGEQFVLKDLSLTRGLDAYNFLNKSAI